MRLCSILGNGDDSRTVVNIETSDDPRDPKSVRYTVVFEPNGLAIDVMRKSKTSPGWRTIWHAGSGRPYGKVTSAIIMAARDLKARSQSTSGEKPSA